MSGYVCGSAVCPLCGEKHMMRAASCNEAGYPKMVGCTVCDIWTPAFDTEEEAIAAWNRRAEHD